MDEPHRGAEEPEPRPVLADGLLTLVTPETRERVRAIADAAPAAEAMVAGLWLISRGTAGQSAASRGGGRAAAPGPDPLAYTVAEAAAMLNVSENWLRDKGRRREIPHSMLGGSYHFTRQHLEEIIRLFEHPAEDPLPPRASVRSPAAPPGSAAGDVPPLKARVPRRLQRHREQHPDGEGPR